MVISLKNAILALFTAFIACVEEERAIYLVLMEGEPTAFVHGNSSLHYPKGRDCDSELLEDHARGLENLHDQLLLSNLEKGSYNKLYSFKHVINGFAIHATNSQAKILKDAHGVKLVERDRGTKMMTTYTPEFLGLPQQIWNQQGGERNAGNGIVIGFIDTGINPLHPSFANTFYNNNSSSSNSNNNNNDNNSSSNNNNNKIIKGLGLFASFSGACETGPMFPVGSCNGKIVSARFFSAGAQATGSLNPSVDILSPFDPVGHGSHVAATAAGNAGVPVFVDGFFYGRASGMAPAARIAVYKAAFPSGGTVADVVAALDQAIRDGVDIISLSVGPDEPPRDTPTVLSAFDIALLHARRAGVFVAQAAGNKGPSPSTVISFSPWVVGVGASTTDRTYPGSLILGNGVRVGGVGLSGPTLGNGVIHYKLVLAEDAVSSTGTFPRTPQNIEECQNPEALDISLVQGSVVICTFSDGFSNQTSTVTAILNTARVLGFMGFVLVANPKYGDFIAEPIPWSIPGILIPKVADAQIVLQYYQAETARNERRVVTAFGGRAAIGEARVAAFNSQRAPTVSRFSSRGPDFIDINRTPVDVLKPDIIAPGHQVWAAWSPISALEPILRGNNFALLSGTSMATPHVVGIAALIMQRNPAWTPSMIASALSTTARKFDNYGGEIMAEGFSAGSLMPSTPFHIGSGHIDPIRVIDPGLVLTTEYQDYIRFLCSLPNINPSMVTAATGELCTPPSGYPSDLNLPSLTISAMAGSRTVRRQVRNVGRTQETYLCAVLPPNGSRISLNPPWFTISPDGVQDLDILIEVTQTRSDFSFGEIVLTGSLNHIVRIPLAIRPVQ